MVVSQEITSGALFSGEPLPLSPNVGGAELDKFHRDLLNYLRRLSTKLDSKVSNTSRGAESLNMFYGNDSTIGTAWTLITWPTIAHVNSLYSVVGGKISVLEQGLYYLDYTLDIQDQDGTDSIESRLQFEDDTGVLGELIYGRTVGLERSHQSSYSFPLVPGLKVSIEAHSTNAARVLGSGGTRLTMFRLSQSVFLGSYGGGGGGTGKKFSTDDLKGSVIGDIILQKR